MKQRAAQDSVTVDISAPPERVYELVSDITRMGESFEAERPLGKAMTWLTMKWTGSQDRDDDVHRGMTTTLERIKVAAEAV